MTTRHRGWIALMALGLAVLACSNLPGNGGTTPPLPTTALLPAATAPLPTDSAALPQIVNTAVFHKPDDSWRLVGELANNTGQTVNHVALHIEWFDASGASLGADTAYLLTTHVAAGETAPFIHNLYTTDLQIDHFTTAVTQSTANAAGAAVAFNYTSTNEIAAGATGSITLTLYLDPALDPNELNVNVVALAPQP